MGIPQCLPWVLTGKPLGSGGQGHVYLVTNREINDGTEYALKVLRNPVSLQARRRFCREIKAVQDIDHCSIIQMYDCAEEHDDFQYYVMEYHHEARPLDSIIASPPTNPFHGIVLSSLDLFEQIIMAIGACEKNNPQITHRDINPEYGWPQRLDHEVGKIRCVQTAVASADQSTKCSSAGVR